METTKLKVKVTERTAANGVKFNAYSTFSKNGRRTDLKFRKEVKNLPTKDCYIIVNTADINLNTAGEYPVCWVSAIQAIEDFATANAEANRAKVKDYFG